jgi:hypothetical protein
MRRAVIVGAMLFAAIGTSTGSAYAAVPSTPNGLTGACNMMQDPTMMTTTMNAISSTGMTGMMGAHTVSGCGG